MKNITKYTKPKHTWNGYRVLVHGHGVTFRQYISTGKQPGPSATSKKSQAMLAATSSLNDLRAILANPRSLRGGSILTKTASAAITALGFKIIK